MLQKLYVGILGLESEVMIHISGVDFKKEKKDRFPTKYITVKQKEWLNLMIGKKYSFKLIGDISETIDP